MSLYSALTIGPIYETIQKAKSTRSIWAASYLFSYIIENIVHYPSIKKDDLLGQHNLLIDGLPAGLYPDRLVFKNKTRTEIEEIVYEIIDGLYKRICDVINETPVPFKHSSQNPILTSLRIGIVQYEFQDGDPNIMQDLHHMLDVYELQPFFNNEGDDVVQKFFAQLEKTSKTKGGADQSRIMLETVLGKAPDIESVFDISASEIPGNDRRKISEKLEEKKGNLVKGQLKNYHKYIAVVQADGDNIGKTIKAIFEHNSSSQTIQDLAKLLMDRAATAVKEIIEYGGLPIYAGGDDLLFFAPVININNGKRKNVFQLIDHLSYEFEKAFKERLFGPNSSYQLAKETEVDIPTLSFGLSITYYKFPLSEAIARSGNLLFSKAKKFKKEKKDRTLNKNAIAINIEKHSGSTSVAEFGLKKILIEGSGNFKPQDLTYYYFRVLLKKFSESENSQPIVSSLIYFLDNHIGTFKAIHRFKNGNPKEKLKNLLLNRPGNNSKELSLFEDTVRKLIAAYMKEKKYQAVDYQPGNLNPIRRTIDILKIVKFLNQSSDE